MATPLEEYITLIFHDIDFMAYKIGQFSFDTKTWSSESFFMGIHIH